MTTGRLLEHWHGGTLTRHSDLDALFPMPVLEVHPVDAEHLGIRDGSPVRVTSRHGSVVCRAHVTEKVNPGIVFLPMHFVEAAANLLTGDYLDPPGQDTPLQGHAGAHRPCGRGRSGPPHVSGAGKGVGGCGAAVPLYFHLWRVPIRSGKGHLRASLHAVSESEEVAKTAPARDYPTKSSRNPQYPSRFFAMSAIMVSYT